MFQKKCNHSLCNQIKNSTLGEDSLKNILKEKSLAVTRPRLSILKTILKCSVPQSVEEIYNGLGKTPCDMATVYRVLHQFEEVGIVNLIHLEKDLVHYEYNNPLHHHHHVICNNCKKIELIEDCYLDQLELFLTKKGYKNLAHKLQFSGLCKSCAV